MGTSDMDTSDMETTRSAELISADFVVSSARSLRRSAVDFAAALFLFAVLAGAFNIEPSIAFPAPPPPELSLASALLPPPTMINAVPTFPGETPRETYGPSPGYTLTLLALAFASLVATNLAIGRHLRSAYATPRRDGQE